MEQTCSFCGNEFESTQIWALEDKNDYRGYTYKSICEECIDKSIEEVGKKHFGYLLEINNYERGHNRHNHC
jgi:hypothetical protein